MRRALVALALVVLGGAGPVSGADGPPNVFDLPHVQIGHMRLQAEIAALMQKGDYAEAEKRCLAAIQRVPHDPNVYYNLACAQARLKKTDEALASLERAVERGFQNAAHMQADADLESLRALERFKKAMEKAAAARPSAGQGWQYRVEPAAIEKGVATVTEKNTAYDPQLLLFRPLFKLDTAPPGTEPIAKGYGPAGDWLRKWQSEGVAAGNRGDLYDNHDSDHSNMGYEQFPQLSRIEFGEAPKARHLHHGLQAALLYNGVTLGNSSTAIVSGPFWRSQARLALTNPRTAALLFAQYAGNHLYMYPEHRDHDPGHNGEGGKGHGDVFCANTPYLIISQGSSGSDRAFLDAAAATLAAFRPEVKVELAKAGALMPALQMVFRSCNKRPSAGKAKEPYLTGAAHPTVFDGNQLDAAKMVQMAHEITKDKLPPLAALTVVEEDRPALGRDYFDVAEREKLFDTPAAVARVCKSVQFTRRMVVSAEPSKDLNRRPLAYHWVVLRGDPERIKINKRNPSGSEVELLVSYHSRRPIAPGSEMESNRVDIGAFVHNGACYSAPAFVSFYFLDNERRVYDARQRIEVVDYADPQASKNYVDPALDFQKTWRDEYRYDPSGKPLGWTRVRGQAKEQFTAEGLLVVKADAQGRPVETRKVRYAAKPRANQSPELEQQ